MNHLFKPAKALAVAAVIAVAPQSVKAQESAVVTWAGDFCVNTTFIKGAWDSTAQANVYDAQNNVYTLLYVNDQGSVESISVAFRKGGDEVSAPDRYSDVSRAIRDLANDFKRMCDQLRQNDMYNQLRK